MMDAGDLPGAEALASQLLQEYPSSPNAPGAQLLLGRIKLKAAPDATQDLLAAFSLVRTKYPCSPDHPAKGTAQLAIRADSVAWPMFMHDAQHTGAAIVPDSTPESLQETWTAFVPTATGYRTPFWFEHPDPKSDVIFPHPFIDSSPVHMAGCPVIVGAWDSGTYEEADADPPVPTTGYVVAFDPVDDQGIGEGRQVWRYPSNSQQYIGGVASTPCIALINGQKRVYIGSMDGNLYCLNAADGTLIWKYQTYDRSSRYGKILGSPVVCNGRVYVGTESAKLYCFDAATNDPNGYCIWSCDLPADATYPNRTGLSSPAIGVVNGVPYVYVGSDTGHVYCISTEDNPSQRVVWAYPGDNEEPLGCVESSPTVCGDRVYVGSSWWQDTDLVCLDASTGELVSSQALGEEVRATAALLGNRLFVGQDTGTTFFRLSEVTLMPDPAWIPGGPNPFDAGDYFVGSAALTTAGYGFVGNDNGNLYTLSTADVSLISTRPTGGIVCSSPAISHAAEPDSMWLYVVSRANGGKLFAYRQQTIRQ